jgi:uncharacterized damage-inducible protein DinB
MHKNPYADDLGDRDPYEALADTPERIRALVGGWRDEQFERTYAPGKWSARQILIHLAQAELALTTRVRFALGQENYTAQPFDQDAWVPIDAHLDARTALDAYAALRRMNAVMFRNLSAAQRERTFNHPEYGSLTPAWVAAQLAGHDIHHYKQLQMVK